MLKRPFLLWPMLGFFLCASHVSLAQTLGINEQIGIRALSMGGAYRAVATGNDALHFNPAGLPFFRRFNVDVDYIYRSWGLPHLAGVSLVDSMTSSLAAGLDFHMGFMPNGNQTDLSYLGMFGLAYPIADVFSIGVLAKYAYLPPMDTDAQVNALTGDVGLMLKLPFGLSLGAVGYNLIPAKSVRLPLSVGFGAAFTLGGSSGIASNASSAYSGFTVAFDWLMRDLISGKEIQHQLSVGGEYYIIGIIPLRAGYTWSKSDQSHMFSAGAGVLLQVIELDGLYQQDITQLDRRSFGGAIRIFF